MAKEVNKRVNIWLNEQGIDNNLKSIRAAIAKTANELNKLPIGSEEWLRKSEKLSKLKSIYSDVQKEIGATSRELDALNKRTMDQIITVGSLSAAAQAASSVLRRFVSATQEYVDAYATLDDAMTNVSKYTGLTREEVKQLNEEFQNMDTRTPTEKLNALAADAGRLGITSKEAIKDFVEAADIINVALGEDLGEDAVKNIGKMAQMFGETETMGLRGAMIATASAINTLAQSSSASEPYIMDFSARLAGVANTAGITQAQIMGIASAMDQNMAQVERSATAVQKVMMDMMGKTEKYANLVGMTADEFRKLVDSDMNTALLTVLDKLKEIRDTGGKSAFAETLDDLKLKGAGVQDTLMMLAEKTDQLREAQQLATQAYADGNSVINEAAAVNGNAAAQLEKAQQAVQSAKAALGEELIPIITDLTKSSASGLKVLTAVVKFWAHHRVLLYSLVGAYGALKLAQKAVIAAQKEEQALTLANTAAGKAYTLVTKLLAVAKAKLAADTEAAAVAQTELKAAFAATPWGAIIVAVTTLATGIGMLISKHREAKKAAEEFNTECAREQAEAQYLFDKLKKAEKGTKDYENALQELKEKYPEIIQKHLDEEGALRDVEQAYKDVIVQIKTKIAEQLKEQQSNAAITKNIEDQTEALDKIREKLRKQGKSESEVTDIVSTIQNMTASGSSSNDIRKKLRESYGLNTKSGVQSGYLFDIGRQIDKMTESQNRMNKSLEETDKRFQPFIKDGQMASDEIAQIDKQIADLQKQLYGENRKEIQKQIEDIKKLKQQKLDTAKVGSGTNQEMPNHSGSPTSTTADKKTITARENFHKKLLQMENKAQADTLEGWEKTKQEIVNKYDELLTEAAKLYGKDSEAFNKVLQMKSDAIAAAGQKYHEKYGKTLEDFFQKFQAWQKEVVPEGKNEMVDAVIGTRQKWIQRTNEVSAQMSELLDLREQFVKDNVDTSSIDALINKLGDELNGMADLEAKDIQKTLEKYQAQIDDFIKAEQKSITDATLTETQRQKNAIEEKYRLEIEHIEKTIAARIAAYGEDDPEVKQLREKIQLLNQLKNQQLANVTSGQKTIWQQLAEFDWSKISDNWQEALDLMGQGLQEFASVAFDIYGSIAQIQDNMMEAELQRTQEAYDAKSAALQRQLDQGVISQKAYDAKMEQLQKEKDAKEKKLKHEQFAREKTADIIKATISGALAAMNAFSQGGGFPWGLIPMAITAAMSAVQIAAIASQPNPYAKGGYIRGRQYAVMGEQGDEWVASNKLLRDKEAATVIAALDDYQRGNALALRGITFATPDPKIMSQAVSGNGRTFAPSNQTTNNYYQNPDNSELLKEIRKMNDFLRDPNNRRAYISRKIQLEFDEQEEEIRSMARL
jgi:TP901 family phage tail tape measure protein